MLGDVEAIVEVGGVPAAEPPPLALVEAVEDALEIGEPLAGDGDTIDAGAVVLDEDEAVDDEDVLASADDDGRVDEVGLELSLCTPLANGSRAIRASSTLTGTLAGACAVVVWLDAGLAAGGAGGNAVPPAVDPLRSSTGTATRATTRSATTGQSLRSRRSRRSALITVLQ